jgi:6-phosphogluconolactonase
VVVSNRGHQSIAIFRVFTKGPRRGELSTLGYFHTRGETPRHFQFDSSGQYLIVANQDTDSIAVFNFNISSGEMKYTGNEYRVPSPNFVCCCPMYGDDDDDMPAETTTALGNAPPNMTEPEEESCESDRSTVPFTVISKENSEDELALARLEIAELKQQIASIMLK